MLDSIPRTVWQCHPTPGKPQLDSRKPVPSGTGFRVSSWCVVSGLLPDAARSSAAGGTERRSTAHVTPTAATLSGCATHGTVGSTAPRLVTLRSATRAGGRITRPLGTSLGGLSIRSLARAICDPDAAKHQAHHEGCKDKGRDFPNRHAHSSYRQRWHQSSLSLATSKAGVYFRPPVAPAG